MKYELYLHLLEKLNGMIPSSPAEQEEIVLLKDRLCDDPASLDDDTQWALTQAIYSLEQRMLTQM